jgi:nucleoid-associated protein YgaU
LAGETMQASTFSDATPSSLDEDAKTRVIEVAGKKITLEVWDTQGQVRAIAGRNCARGCSGEPPPRQRVGRLARVVMI